MHDHPDDIHALMRSADAASPPSSTPPASALAAGVLARGARRRVARQAIGGASLAALLVSVCLIIYHQRQVETAVVHLHPAPAPDSLSSAMELREIEAEIALHARTADLLLLAEQVRVQPVAVARLDPLADLRRQREAAATLFISQGDRSRRNGDGPDESIHLYRMALELFPSTSAARVAARRLEEPRT